jgi:hypothetical protein
LSLDPRFRGGDEIRGRSLSCRGLVNGG